MAVYPWTAWSRVAPVWSELARVSPHCSFFLTEVWVQTWIETFGSKLGPSVVLFESGHEPVGICLLVKTTPRHAMIPLRRISLNASGEAAADTTYIEFNNLLCRGGWEGPVSATLARYLIGQDWDEVALDGFVPGPAYRAIKTALAHFDLQETWHPSYCVDLSELRRSGTAYEMMLSSSTRRSLRQSVRSYSELGPVRLEHAANLDAALAMLDDLSELNKRRWAGRRGPLVFASPYFRAFHRALIQKCLGREAVQLLRLLAGRHTVGLLYNLVHAGKVYFYQCGLDYSVDKRLSPGTTILSYAIQHCLDLGFEDCDFLSGEATYKRCLSTGSRRLVWAVFRRPGVRVRILDIGRRTKRWLLETWRDRTDVTGRRESRSSHESGL